MVLFIMAAVYSELTGSRIYDIRINKCINTIFFQRRKHFFDLSCPYIVKICGGKNILKYFKVYICVKITPWCDTGV